MHESQQQQRVNSKMSIGSSSLSLSKILKKKNPLYQHDDASKLNYYARFSPNRKKIQEDFHFQILNSSLISSPKTQKSSASSKKSSNSYKKKDYQVQNIPVNEENIQLIKKKLLQYCNHNHKNQDQIYIDENDTKQEQVLNMNEPKNSNSFDNPKPVEVQIKDYEYGTINKPIYQTQKQSSQSQESQFERIVEPSSSEENDISFVPITKASDGQQMLIEDNDSQDNSNDLNCQYLLHGVESQNRIKTNDINLYYPAHHDKIGKREVQSENISFSVDSDLSIIEERWNSYFENEQNGSECGKEIFDKPFFTQNVCKNLFKSQDSQEKKRKRSSSSDDSLPSFSNPDFQNPYYTPLQINRSSVFEQEIQRKRQYQMDVQNQSKEFKRQFTFGSQLNVINIEIVESQSVQNQAKGPFDKNIVANTLSLEQKINKKSVENNNKILKAIDLEMTQKPNINYKKQITQQQHFEHPNDNMIHANEDMQQVFQSNFEIRIEDQDGDQAQMNFIQSINRKQEQILIVQSQEQQQWFQPQKVQLQKPLFEHNFRKQDFSLEKVHEKAKKRAMWQQNLRKMFEEEQKLKQSQTQSIYPSSNQSQTSEYHQQYQQSQSEQHHQQQQSQQQQLDPHQTESSGFKHLITESEQTSEVFSKRTEPNSYAKIHTNTRVYRNRKGSYNDKAKVSSTYWQTNDADSVSQHQKRSPQQRKTDDKESLTTTTEDITQNFQVSEGTFSKNRVVCSQQVQNLKKYLKKIEKPLKIQNSKTSPASSQISQREVSHFKKETQQNVYELNEETHYFQKSQANFIQKQNIKRKEVIFGENEKQSFQPTESKRVQEAQKIEVQTPIKQLYRQKSQDELVGPEESTKKICYSFHKIILMLQQTIPTLPKELVKVYEKIYNQVYQQQLVYQRKLKKQEVLLKFLEDSIKGQRQYLDCKSYIKCEDQAQNEARVAQQNQRDEEESQILINQHIIMALVRNLASV